MTINANRFIAPVINPQLLARPDVIETIDAEAILAARMADFQTRADGTGFPYDVGDLETDPIKLDQEVHAYRETLMRARVNSGIRAVLPAYARGTDLQAIAARANVQRLVLVPANPQNNTPAVMESDASLLLRYLTSFAVPSCGSPDGYIFHSVMAWPQVRDIAVLGPSVHNVPGRAAIYLLADGGVAPTEDQITAVRERLLLPNVKPLTDEVIVAAAAITEYAVDITIEVPRGPAPAVVAEAVRKAIQAVADARYAIGADVYMDNLAGVSYINNVLRVTLNAPVAHILPGPSGAAFCTGVTVNTTVAP